MERIHWALHFFLNGRETDCGTVPVLLQSWAELMNERSFQINLFVRFWGGEGNPVKGDLANFEGFCCIAPSVHAALGKCSRESRLQITVWA